MRLINDMGYIKISNEVIADICGYAVSNCFGVKGITSTGMSDGIMQLLKKDNMSKGVKVTYSDGGINLELHIAVEYGVNMVTVGKSIMNEVKFVVEHYTEVKVNNISVCIDYVFMSNEA